MLRIFFACWCLFSSPYQYLLFFATIKYRLNKRITKCHYLKCRLATTTRSHQRKMINVLIVLLASLCCPLIVSTYFFDDYLYTVGYVEYSTGQALVYLVIAFVGVLVARFEIMEKRNFSAILICALCFCMCVTAIFNLIMINKDIFNALNEIKSGNGLSWSSIYASTEILIAFIVGGNGLNYLAHVDICPHGKRNAIIRNNPNSHKSKQ